MERHPTRTWQQIVMEIAASTDPHKIRELTTELNQVYESEQREKQDPDSNKETAREERKFAGQEHGKNATCAAWKRNLDVQQ